MRLAFSSRFMAANVLSILARLFCCHPTIWPHERLRAASIYFYLHSRVPSHLLRVTVLPAVICISRFLFHASTSTSFATAGPKRSARDMAATSRSTYGGQNGAPFARRALRRRFAGTLIFVHLVGLSGAEGHDCASRPIVSF
jgi:hypothetical protein